MKSDDQTPLTDSELEELEKVCPELLEELDGRTLFTYRETGEDIECNVSFKRLLAIARRFLELARLRKGKQ